MPQSSTGMSPIIRPLGDSFHPGRRRRSAVLGVAVVVVVGVAALIVSNRGDEGSDSAQPAASPVELDPSTTAVSELVPERPTHHGFNDDVLYVALYGSIQTESLGALGEQRPRATLERAAAVAAEYADFGREVVPTFEIIASVASFDAGDGDYSNEESVGQLRPWIDAADRAGYHVVLDLQSGRESFHSQILEFEPLLLEPHVSVALDPEWRVGPSDVPKAGRIGAVTGGEVNLTIDYLDELVEANGLPPKMLIVHQFVDRMIVGKESIRGTDNVQVVLHMDGFGPLRLKRDTYAKVTADLPDGVLVGWKNFYDEDDPTPTPTETMAADPLPMFVSFQ